MKIAINELIIDNNCILAENFWQKLIGKTFSDKTFLLKNCNSIHTIFLKHKIDVVFLSSDNRVVKILENLPPRVVIFPVKDAKHVIEFNAGFVKSAKINLGDILHFEE